MRERTLLIQRSISLGDEADTKTRQHRTVRLLAPLASDLRAWRIASPRPSDDTLIFPGPAEEAIQAARAGACTRLVPASAIQAAG